MRFSVFTMGFRPAKPGNAQGLAFMNAGACEARCSRFILIGGEELVKQSFRVDAQRQTDRAVMTIRQIRRDRRWIKGVGKAALCRTVLTARDQRVLYGFSSCSGSPVLNIDFGEATANAIQSARKKHQSSLTFNQMTALAVIITVTSAWFADQRRAPLQHLRSILQSYTPVA